jgi:hypothetical protein
MLVAGTETAGVVARPCALPRNTSKPEAASESYETRGSFFVGYGFSDQCYLVRTSAFRAPIYGEKNALSERYPWYGGELFEKRVDSWMRNNCRPRLTHRSAWYRHLRGADADEYCAQLAASLDGRT